jgi:hypothetical protein
VSNVYDDGNIPEIGLGGFIVVGGMVMVGRGGIVVGMKFK